MSTTTISPKYQVVMPKEVRDKLRLKSGQKMTMLTKGGIIGLIPEKPFKSFGGFLEGMDSKNLREGEE